VWLMLVLVATGIIGLLTVRQLTVNAWKKAGLADAPIEVLKATSGTGIVPSYISYIYFASLALLGIGILGLVLGWGC
jgi:hypothetical protein